MSLSVPPVPERRRRVYEPAVGPKLRPLLWVVMVGFALLGANGAYLASVTFLQWARGTLQQTYFSLLMVIVHLMLGFLILVPFLVFGFAHLATSWKRPNRAAVRWGLGLLMVGLVVLVSGFVLMRVEIPLGRYGSVKLEVRDPTIHGLGYWLHVALPFLVIALYLRHRLAGPRVKWEYARLWLGGVGAFVAVMAVLHTHDPRAVRRSADPKYTFPSEVKLAGNKLISERALMMDDYCKKCHEDAYQGWFHSSHHFSSFNNKPYLFSVRETRKVSLARDGNTRAALVRRLS